MRTAFAVTAEGMLSPTLGTAVFFLIRTGDEPPEKISARGMIPETLKKAGADRLFCGGIGMCLLSLINAEGITVVPGCSGDPDAVWAAWKKGTLTPDPDHLCADHGRSCGSCPGRF